MEMSKDGVLPSEWGLLRPPSGGRHEVSRRARDWSAPGVAAGVGKVVEVGQDRGGRRGVHAGTSVGWISHGPSPGRVISHPKVPEIPLAPPGQFTQHSAMALGPAGIADGREWEAGNRPRIPDGRGGATRQERFRPRNSSGSLTSQGFGSIDTCRLTTAVHPSIIFPNAASCSGKNTQYISSSLGS